MDKITRRLRIPPAIVAMAATIGYEPRRARVASSFRLRAETLADIRRLADRDNLSQSQVIERAIAVAAHPRARNR